MSYSTRRSAAVSGGVLALLVVACSSTSTPTTPSPEDAVFSGTYAADSDDGAAPFDAITFSAALRYSYIARNCNAPATPVDGDLGTDSPPSSDVANCVHQGSYTVDAATSSIVLTDDGQSASLWVPVSITAVESAGSASDAIVQEPGQLAPADSPASPTLVQPSGSLVGASTVNKFSASGTPLTQSDPSGRPLVLNQYVALALQWANAMVPYCWATNHGHETDSDCVKIHGTTCNRTGPADNALWNAYRSDCSGLVSYAWGIPAPGTNTNGFVSKVAKYIPANTLQPGDALLAPGKHVGLFEKWVDQSSGKAMMIAEPGCTFPTPYAQEQEWDLQGSGAPGSAPGGVWNDGEETETFFAIRKR